MNRLHLSGTANRRDIIFLALAAGCYFFANFQRVSVPGTMFDQLQSGMGCSAAAVVAAGTCFMYTYAFTQLVIGVLADKYGGARVLLCGSLIFCLGSLLFPLSGSMTGIYLSRIAAGLGAGAIYLSILKECDRLFPGNFAFMCGMVLFTGYSGGVAGTFPLAAAVEAWGWRIPMFAAGAAGCAIAGAGWYVFRRCRRPAAAKGALSFRPVIDVFRRRASWTVFGSSNIVFAVYSTVLSCMGKKFLEDFGGMSPVGAAACVSMLIVISAVCNVIVGTLAAISGNRRRIFMAGSAALSLLGSLMMIAGVLLHCSGAWFGTAYAVYAVSSAISPVCLSLIKEANDPAAAGAATGASNFTAYIMVALLGSLAGAILDLFRSQAAVSAGAVIYPASAYLTLFAVMLALNILALTVSFFTPYSAGRKRKPARR